jgi:hypothetical protein
MKHLHSHPRDFSVISTMRTPLMVGLLARSTGICYLRRKKEVCALMIDVLQEMDPFHVENSII